MGCGFIVARPVLGNTGFLSTLCAGAVLGGIPRLCAAAFSLCPLMLQKWAVRYFWPAQATRRVIVL
jgi:hypothetical protein